MSADLGCQVYIWLLPLLTALRFLGLAFFWYSRCARRFSLPAQWWLFGFDSCGKKQLKKRYPVHLVILAAEWSYCPWHTRLRSFLFAVVNDGNVLQWVWRDRNCLLILLMTGQTTAQNRCSIQAASPKKSLLQHTEEHKVGLQLASR